MTARTFVGVACSAILGITALTPAPALATEHLRVRVLAHFDRAAGQTPESIAPEPDGGAVVGMVQSRQVVRVGSAGRVRVLVTMPLPPRGAAATPVVGGAQVTGVVRSADGDIYFLYAAGGGGLTGIWRMPPGDNRPTLVVPLPADTFPNALAVSGRRFLVTDSAGGRIWQAPRTGGHASVWSADPALAPDSFFGANGLKVHDGAVWTSNSDRGTLVRIPMARRGTAGPADVRAEGIAGIDDFDFTGAGDDVLAAVNQGSELVRVRSGGSHEVVLSAADGLQGTSAVVVRGHRVFVANSAHQAGADPTLMVVERRR